MGPFREYLVRGMHAAGRPVKKKWLVGRLRVLLIDPLNGLLRQVFCQVVFRIARGFDGLGVIKEARAVLVGFSAQKAIKMVKPIAGWPVIERTLRACFKSRRVVPLAKGGRSIAFGFQQLRYRRRAGRNHTGVSVKTFVCHLGDRAVAHPVVVASR